MILGVTFPAVILLSFECYYRLRKAEALLFGHVEVLLMDDLAEQDVAADGLLGERAHVIAHALDVAADHLDVVFHLHALGLQLIGKLLELSLIHILLRPTSKCVTQPGNTTIPRSGRTGRQVRGLYSLMDVLSFRGE